METLWLGYDGLDLPFREIVAVLLYQPALDLRITLAFGQGGCKVASGGGLGVAKPPPKDLFFVGFWRRSCQKPTKSVVWGAAPATLHQPWAFGSVPHGVQAVVVTSGGAFLPARWCAHQLHRRWAHWRSCHSG